MKPMIYRPDNARGLNGLTMVAFVPYWHARKVHGYHATNPRLVVSARTEAECIGKLERICRDFGLPVRATLASRRMVNSPYDHRTKRRVRAR